MTRIAPARTLRLFALTALIAAVSLALSGCVTPNSGGTQSGSSSPSSSGQNVKVPSDARRVDATTGTPRPFRTLRDGTIYVQDKGTGRVVYHGPVRAYDNVVIDPKANAVTVNDQQVVNDPKLDPHHTYLLFFVQK